MKEYKELFLEELAPYHVKEGILCIKPKAGATTR